MRHLILLNSLSSKEIYEFRTSQFCTPFMSSILGRLNADRIFRPPDLGGFFREIVLTQQIEMQPGDDKAICQASSNAAR